jgi:hypothetical protein
MCRKVVEVRCQAFHVPAHGLIHFACVPRPGRPAIPVQFSLDAMPRLATEGVALFPRPAHGAAWAALCTGTRSDAQQARPNIWG